MFNKQEIEFIKKLLSIEYDRLGEVEVELQMELIRDISKEGIKNIRNIIKSIEIKLEEMRNENKKIN